MSTGDQAIELAVEQVLAQMEQGWNVGDGDAFAEPFTDDADFVTVRGERSAGKAAIASSHSAIFETIYVGSEVHYSLVDVSEIAPSCLLAHSTAELKVPGGPLEGTHNAVQTIVLTSVDGSGQWRVRAFQNTLLPEG